MNMAISVSAVHESEAQRQFTRAKLPACIRYIGISREGVDARLLDLFVSSFALTASDTSIRPDDLYKGKLLFQTGSINSSFEVGFQVHSADPTSRRIGCEFRNLKPREVAALRYLITPYLAGGVIGIGGMLNTPQRENFTRVRKQGGDNGGTGFFGRIWAVTLSTVVFVVGAGAFASTLNQTYNLYFATHVGSSVASVPNQQITMPRGGAVQSLLGSDAEVAKSAPIAISSVNLLDVFKGNLTEEQLSPGNIKKLFGHQMRGALTSPYDYRAVRQLIADGQYVNKDQAIFTPTPCDSVAGIEARFPYRNAAELVSGTWVSFQVADDGVNRSGRIVNTAPVNGDLPSEIRMQIQPDQPLDTQYVGCPTEVSIGDLPGHTLLNKAVTLVTAY